MNHNWYAVITAKVLMAKDLSSTQKLLMALISNLSNEKGYCYASNKYLGECLDISQITVSKNVAELEEKGYISRILNIDPVSKEIKMRVIVIKEHPNTGGMVEKGKTSRRKRKDPMVENDYTPMVEKAKDNNKDIKTNIITNRKEGKKIEDLLKPRYDDGIDYSWLPHKDAYL
jgi:DNA-binding transcriptional regulator YhcF (GntR family)